VNTTNPLLEKIIQKATIIAGFAAILSLIRKNYFVISASEEIFLVYFDLFIAFLFVYSFLFRFLKSRTKVNFFRESPIESSLFIFFIISFIAGNILELSTYIYNSNKIYQELLVTFIQFYIFTNGIITLIQTRDKWLIVSLNPARTLVFSFFMVIVVGTTMLMLPRCTFNGVRWIDALFISTSAVCVTGLVSVNIVDLFTLQGQVIIMILIQVGGLGIITLTSFIVVYMQREFRLKDEVLVQEIFDDEYFNTLAKTLKSIILITLFFEILGAIFLYISWGDYGRFTPFERLFNAVFHSVSAYCNAGFSSIHNGLETPYFSTHAPTLIIIMLLIIFGGIGFYTINDFLMYRTDILRGRRRLNLQTKIILISTFILIFGGALLIWLVQAYDWRFLSVKQQILNSFFASVTCRTAGYANVSIGTFTIPAVLIMIFLMYVGASPNSTSGGIKNTTAVTLLLSFITFVRGGRRVEIGWNSIPDTTIRRVYIVFFASISLVCCSSFLLTISENFNFLDILFETVSAFGTVGLTRGITPYLSDFGKMVIIIVMFLGRVGMFTVAITVRDSQTPVHYKFPENNIMVG